MPDLDRGALSLADLAHMETTGSMAAKTEAAIWAYLWAQENMRPLFPGVPDGLQAYPSLNELRDALAERAAHV